MKKSITTLLLLLAVHSAFGILIKDIRIVNQASENYDISSVSAFTSFTVGEDVKDEAAVRESIAVDVNRMRESGRYSYVNARMDVDEDGVVLVYTVVSKHKLRRIHIKGADRMRNKKVRKKSELEIGQFADEATFAQAAAKIKAAYREFWYPYTMVEWSTEVAEELGTVDVMFTIKEGRKLGIKKVDFEGNDSIEAKTLRKVIQQKQKSLFSFITGSGKYKEETEDLDVFTIKSLYMNQGFLDVHVSDSVLDDSNPKRARMIFKIDEGQRYVVRDKTITGMKEFTAAELRKGIRLRIGDIASYEAIEQGSENIRAFYGNRGFIRTAVRSVLDADSETGTVAIRYEVTEGVIGYIENINITGNERTKDKVIRRELVIHPGDKYNRSRVKTSENRLRNTTFFESVIVSPEPTEESGKYDLNVQLKEGRTGHFSAGVGFSSIDSLVGFVELSQGNYDFKSWPPVGAGQKFKIRATLGTQRNDFEISFLEPWFMDRKLSLGLDYYHREARYFSDAYDQENDGIRVSVGKRLSPFMRGTLAYTLEEFDVFDVQASASQAIQDEEGERVKSSLDFILSRDTRNHPFAPTKGNRTSVTPYFAGGSLGGETDIIGVKTRTAHYWSLPGDMILSMLGRAESVEAFGNSRDSAAIGDGVPIFDRLFLGGPYSLRGYEYRDVGPQSGNDPIGGNSSAFASLELTYPFFEKIRGAVYYDWGVVNVDAWDFDTSLYNDNWGIGIRFNLPGFPLRLDYAWPITFDEEIHDDNGRFNFIIGHRF